MIDPKHTDIKSLSSLLSQKKISSVGLTRFFLDRITKLNPELNAFITVCEDFAIKQAKAADQTIARGEATSLTGIPIAPKDIYLTKNIQTTCASNVLRGFIPPYNAHVIDRCLDHGAVIIGKTNLDEFAMGSSNENSAFGCVRNPWNRDHTPGGSSGGSAAAVAAYLCAASLGTDTGGSIRQPASHCGIVGLKPTYGRVSRYGTIAYASSLDQMGPMTRTVHDAAILLEVIAGHDKRDSTSINHSVPKFSANLKAGINGIRIGVPKEFFQDALQDEVKSAVMASLNALQKCGATLVDISLPHTRYSVATYYIIAPAEASSNLSRYDGVRFGLREPANSLEDMYKRTRKIGFGDEVKRRILVGTYVLSSGYYDAYYVQAQKARRLIRDDYINAFKSVDAIAGPVAPTTAFKLGEKCNDPLQMYLSDILTIPVNLAGLPAISVPCGHDKTNMPIGLQIIGRPFDEETILKIAATHESQCDAMMLPE